MLLACCAWLAPAAHAAAPLAVTMPPRSDQILFTRLDPVTLTPVGRNVSLGEWHGGWSFSPDGSQVAFGIQARTGVKVVDVATMETVRDIPQDVFAGPLAWLRSDRLITLVNDTAPTLVDPSAGRTLRHLRGRGCGAVFGSSATAATRRAMVWFTPRALTVTRADGHPRAAAIPLDAGDCEDKGVAASGARAWLGGPSGVTEVSLHTMHLTHTVRRASPRGSHRVSVVPLGAHRLAISHETEHFRPAGVELVDMARGSARVVDPKGGGARFAHGRLLVFDGGYDSLRSPPHRGLRVYDRRGRLRYRRLRGKAVWDVQVHGRRAWLLGSSGVTVIRVAGGRVVSRSRARPPLAVTFLDRAR